MGGTEDDLSRIEANRMAVAIVVGSSLVVIGLGVLYWAGVFDVLLPAGGLVAEDLPLLIVVPVLLVMVVAWGWLRVVSFFE